MERDRAILAGNGAMGGIVAGPIGMRRGVTVDTGWLELDPRWRDRWGKEKGFDILETTSRIMIVWVDKNHGPKTCGDPALRVPPGGNQVDGLPPACPSQIKDFVRSQKVCLISMIHVIILSRILRS